MGLPSPPPSLIAAHCCSCLLCVGVSAGREGMMARSAGGRLSWSSPTTASDGPELLPVPLDRPFPSAAASPPLPSPCMVSSPPLSGTSASCGCTLPLAGTRSATGCSPEAPAGREASLGAAVVAGPRGGTPAADAAVGGSVLGGVGEGAVPAAPSALPPSPASLLGLGSDAGGCPAAAAAAAATACMWAAAMAWCMGTMKSCGREVLGLPAPAPAPARGEEAGTTPAPG